MVPPKVNELRPVPRIDRDIHNFVGRRWPFIIAGAITTLIFDIIWLSMPLYTHLRGHFAYFYLMTLGVRLEKTRRGIIILTFVITDHRRATDP
jgi:Na+/melibiose symporter-like transporter